MEKRFNKIQLIFGLIILLTSITLGFLSINHWYFIGTIGSWLFFSSIVPLKNKSTFDVLKKNKKDFIFLYFIFFLLGCGFEIVGRFILNFWAYPYVNSISLEVLILICYPFILFSFRDSYVVLKRLTKSKTTAVITSTIIGIVIWETPNAFSKDWIYQVNHILNLDILNLNIIVILSWVTLILFPVTTFEKLFPEK